MVAATRNHGSSMTTNTTEQVGTVTARIHADLLKIAQRWVDLHNYNHPDGPRLSLPDFLSGILRPALSKIAEQMDPPPAVNRGDAPPPAPSKKRRTKLDS